jgi:hypothetical protein
VQLLLPTWLQTALRLGQTSNQAERSNLLANCTFLQVVLTGGWVMLKQAAQSALGRCLVTLPAQQQVGCPVGVTAAVLTAQA